MSVHNTTPYCSNPKSYIFQLHRTASTRLHVSEIYKRNSCSYAIQNKVLCIDGLSYCYVLCFCNLQFGHLTSMLFVLRFSSRCIVPYWYSIMYCAILVQHFVLCHTSSALYIVPYQYSIMYYAVPVQHYVLCHTGTALYIVPYQYSIMYCVIPVQHYVLCHTGTALCIAPYRYSIMYCAIPV